MLVTIVNACLRDGRGGSPTAVLEEASLTDVERCQVPQLMGTSHAVFVSADDGDLDRPRASLRFFTAAGELPGCGHGTVAALAFLAENAKRDRYRVTLRASERSFAGEATRGSGHVSAAFDPGAVQLRQATVDERVAVLDALGHDPDILVPEICVASIGRPRLLVALSTPTAVVGLQPDYDQLREACDRFGLLGCYVHSVPTAEGRLSARMFAPSIGVPEDIANANSTACLAARLLQRNVTRITAEMGDSLGSPATITATTQQTRLGARIRVGGAAKVIQKHCVLSATSSTDYTHRTTRRSMQLPPCQTAADALRGASRELNPRDGICRRCWRRTPGLPARASRVALAVPDAGRRGRPRAGDAVPWFGVSRESAAGSGPA